MANIVLPLNISFKEWGSQLRIDLPNTTIPIPPDDIREWRGWASQLIYGNVLSNVPAPTTLAYPSDEDWRKWAAYFIYSLTTI